MFLPFVSPTDGLPPNDALPNGQFTEPALVPPINVSLLLDTEHGAAPLRRKLDLGDHVSADEELFLSAVSGAELTDGAHRPVHSQDNLARLDALLAALTMLPFDESAESPPSEEPRTP